MPDFDPLAEARHIALSGTNRLLAINNRLLQIREEIRALQPKKQGAVLFEVYNCGPGCLGCPHPRWVKWKSLVRNNEVKFAGHAIKGEPGRMLNRIGIFEAAYQPTLARVQEVKALLKERSAIIKGLQEIRRAIP